MMEEIIDILDENPIEGSLPKNVAESKQTGTTTNFSSNND